ncbi:GntR family transcriptional regulator [Tepidamorphus gemmatus]|uniref:GntR family transcriptional regulator n=1 Tax=Tepidamorphus gemmatus TaxID=747076 RepID=A0A4R3M5I2_9HYPH|nr:PLP-dependent aminotransferase family protein [Tepidamorphus gemmatus]TCT06485.1 GntR family transcriptional regulator [Tepidamorphus gemmatus]
MTNWLPDITDGRGPIYLRLADRIEADIGAGLLQPGARLPPQRNLAFDLGVTIGTVGRAYSVLRERGLVSGEIGRGTFVRGKDVSPGDSATQTGTFEGSRPHFVTSDKLMLDSTAAPDVGQSLVFGRLAAEIARDHPAEIVGYTRRIPSNWLEAGQRWLATADWQPEAATIVPTLGVHAAILAIVAAIAGPGDRIVFEHLTYSHVARSVELIGRRSVAVETDAEGVDPADFDRLCAQMHPKAIFMMPCLHNPTLVTMPEARRREIVGIARRYNVWLIEDAIYAALLDEHPLSFAALAPERTFHVGGLSKAVAAGFRGGWVACPPNLASRVLTTYRMISGGKPFLLAELAARLVLSGEAAAIRARVCAEIEARAAMASEIFGGFDVASHPRAPFVWMKLPEPWLSATFKQAAANEGVLIDDEDEFKAVRTECSFHRVRIGFSSPPREALAGGFTKLRALLDSEVAAYDRFG